VRQARVPSVAALNPEVEAEVEQIVRKALARDPEDRYQNANDLGDALAQYLFSRRMKVTARDIANLVKDTQVEMMRKRSSEPKESLIDALILDEMQKMTSLIEAEGNGVAPGGASSEGSMSLDPSAFVDTSNWAGELGHPSGQAPALKRPSRPTAPRSKPGVPTPPPGDIESLEQMLEPERTGVHKKDDRPPWALIIVIMRLLAAAAAVGVVVAMQ
jgi:serine/threonine-protein kinase